MSPERAKRHLNRTSSLPTVRGNEFLVGIPNSEHRLGFPPDFRFVGLDDLAVFHWWDACFLSWPLTTTDVTLEKKNNLSRFEDDFSILGTGTGYSWPCEQARDKEHN